MKKITLLLILLSMFLTSLTKVYAAEINGTINEVLVPTQPANKSAILFIPVSSCVLGSDSDYCQFYVDLNDTRVGAIKVTRSTPKINNNKYYQLTFDYSRAKVYDIKKGKEDNQNVIKITTGSTSITTYGYTPKMTKIIGTCNSKANLAKEQGVVLTRKEGTKKVQEFEELINVVNGPAGYDVAAGTGIKYPMYILYTYQGSEFLNYFDYSYREDTILDMYSPYLPEKINNLYPYDGTYGGHKIGYEETGFQEINDVVLFTEELLEELEGKGIKSDVEKGTAGPGYVEIPGSCHIKYKWRKKVKITYTDLEDCVLEHLSTKPGSGYRKISGVQLCGAYCGCKIEGRQDYIFSHVYRKGNYCDCKDAPYKDTGKTLRQICEKEAFPKYGPEAVKKCKEKVKKDYASCLELPDLYRKCKGFSYYPYYSCTWNPPQVESVYNSCYAAYSAAYNACNQYNKKVVYDGYTYDNCIDSDPIVWGTTVKEYAPPGCEDGYRTVTGICKEVKKSYTSYEYYNGVTWISGNSKYAVWTLEDLTGLDNVEKMDETEFCSYYNPGEIGTSDQTTGLVTYELPLAYVEKGTGYVYNNDNKSTATNSFIKETGERKLYTDLTADDNKNYTIRVIGANIGFNKYSYDLSCKFNLLANGLFKPIPGQEGLIVYRPIDPKDPFPRYAPLANWQGKEYLITRLGYGVYTITPEYEIGMDSISINAIRSYNASNACKAGQKTNCGYLDYNINEKGESSFIHKMFSNLFKVNKK